MQQQLAFPTDNRGSGYVLDNMEGAVDQAAFLARVDIPIAVVGARGTGKMYVARIIHEQSGGAPEQLQVVDCREFRNRKESQLAIKKALQHSAGTTLVFKSPHLLHREVQAKLARQLATRAVADANPPRYLPAAKYVALLPETIEALVRRGQLHERLASVFGGYPIHVPPLCQRRRAVLRWAEKILVQECADRQLELRSFTPEAEQAMLGHDWSGNISEIRQRVARALDGTERELLAPVDLGLSALGEAPREASPNPLDLAVDTSASPPLAAVLDELDVALATCVDAVLRAEDYQPLGTWLSDEVISAAQQRYRSEVGKVAGFLHTSTRNVNRWTPKVEERAAQRSAAQSWSEVGRLVSDWVRETPRDDEPPQQILSAMLLRHLEQHSGQIAIKVRAQLMGLSVPTYQKRLQSTPLGSDGSNG